ncbi:uracil-DNA glycosylase [Arthrobacter zhaoxinii]|uniref:uracil-DNA glycosylase n=1 Tax=Arthrobacter zhaoxinii TaxID=2964616 RepID=UPI0021082FAB|nr:uracil-DNA glycosylase [Arthrobacter zhaoxinii]
MTTDEPLLFSYTGEPAPKTPFPFAAPTRLEDLMAPDWAQVMAPARTRLEEIAAELEAERRAGQHILPAPENILRAFQRPLASARVLIVGQDPYPTPGHAVGLSFSVGKGVRPLPRSLNNIFTELKADLGIGPSPSGDLSAWADQGVVLLNRVLTVRAGEAGSHRKRGWEEVTELAVRALASRRRPDGTQVPLVAILWGRDAQGIVPFLGGAPTVESAHPSPLSASRGFFGSRPFSRANELLVQQGAEPVDWRLGAVR